METKFVDPSICKCYNETKRLKNVTYKMRLKSKRDRWEVFPLNTVTQTQAAPSGIVNRKKAQTNKHQSMSTGIKTDCKA